MHPLAEGSPSALADGLRAIELHANGLGWLALVFCNTWRPTALNNTEMSFKNF
ncbi:MAG: hypothetical protein WCO80_11945 [Betaproteobacteria bacterium]